MLTKRQWVMLQMALCEYRESLEDEKRTVWWDEAWDGPLPEPEEVDALAQIVGDMDHE